MRVRANNASGGGGGAINTEVITSLTKSHNQALTIPTQHKCAGTFEILLYNAGGGNVSHTLYVYDPDLHKLNAYRQDGSTPVGTTNVTAEITDNSIVVPATWDPSTSNKPVTAFSQYYE